VVRERARHAAGALGEHVAADPVGEVPAAGRERRLGGVQAAERLAHLEAGATRLGGAAERDADRLLGPTRAT